ncbi:MAG TPA: hypothetical protein DEU93_03170 [Chitinophagaceae bacterium]|nr:hypothetical protein [Chitinophagaceae bacterium]
MSGTGIATVSGAIVSVAACCIRLVLSFAGNCGYSVTGASSIQQEARKINKYRMGWLKNN